MLPVFNPIYQCCALIGVYNKTTKLKHTVSYNITLNNTQIPSRNNVTTAKRRHRLTVAIYVNDDIIC